MKSVLPQINAKKTVNELKLFISSACKKEGIKRVVIAVSGGVDSATSASLSVLSLGKTTVYPVLLPYGKLNREGAEDALFLIKQLNIPQKNMTTVDIKPFVDKIVKHDRLMDQEEKGRVMARMRMVVLYHLAKKKNALVVGTENKSEHLLGYYTRFGDEASDVEPLRNLYKTQVFHLARYLKVPQKILKKAPTAGLWEGQTDEEQFGFSYEIADEILYLHYEKKLSKKEIIAKGFDKQIIERVWWWTERGEFKASFPYLPPIS